MKIIFVMDPVKGKKQFAISPNTSLVYEIEILK